MIRPITPALRRARLRGAKSMRSALAAVAATVAVAAGFALGPPGIGMANAATASISSTASNAGTQPVPPFAQCPAIGQSPSCEILLVVNPDDSVSVLGDPAVGPFDGGDDTLVGIQNDSSSAVSAVTVSGPGSGLSGFDGDGICSGDYGSWNGSSGCPCGLAGYEGPGTSLVTQTSLPDSAEIDFTGGLAAGSSAYFSLEGALTSAELTARRGQLTEFNCPSTAPMLSAPTTSATPQPLGTYVAEHAATTVDGQAFGALTTEGNEIVDAAGNPVRLAAVNWYGAESADFVPMGLDQQPVDVIAEEIADMGFNAVRLPWSNELVECNPLVSPNLVSANPQFYNQPAMTVFDGVVNALADAGLMVILDNHLTDAGWCCSASDSNGLWWSSKENTTDYSGGQAHWVADWATMVQRYAGQPAVIGVDLRNEPRGAAYWGGATAGQPDGTVADSSQASPNSLDSCPVAISVDCDWRWAAQQEGNAVLNLDRNLLVFVEGTSFATDLTGAYTSPVVLNDPAQLVYSPHVYSFAGYCNANDHSQCPPGVVWEGGGSNGSPPPCKIGPVPFPCTPITTFDFLANWKGLGRALDSQWGFLAESGDNAGNVTPIWIGEFGTTSWTAAYKPQRIVPDSDQNKWFLQLIGYLGQRPFSWSYWALNGTQSDPGPILPQPSPPRSFGQLESYGLLNVQWDAPSPYLLARLGNVQQ